MQIEQLARVFKALSNPHRLKIYLKLSECCGTRLHCNTDLSDPDTCVGEVASGLKLAPSTVSHHLKELREAGLIRMEKNGQKSLCIVEQGTLSRVCQALQKRTGQWPVVTGADERGR